MFLSGGQGHGEEWLLIFGWWWWWGGGGVMQKRESPEFTFPEVHISARERETFEFQSL